MRNRTGKRVHTSRRRLVALMLVTATVSAAPSTMVSAATVSDSADATVTLDTPGSVTVDGFDPARGRLTAVALSLRVDVLVQVCIENTGAAAAPVGAGTATASLTAEFPAGTNRTTADVDTAITPSDLAASNGTADCAAGYETTAGRFPTAVTATDAAYSQGTDQTISTTTLTTTAAMTPFNRTGAVTVAYTPLSDTELAYPAEWNNLSVAQGQLRATVTYTYTPTSGGGGSLPFTGSTGGRIAALAISALLAGTIAVLIARHRRTTRTTPPATP